MKAKEVKGYFEHRPSGTSHKQRGERGGRNVDGQSRTSKEKEEDLNCFWCNVFLPLFSSLCFLCEDQQENKAKSHKNHKQKRGGKKEKDRPAYTQCHHWRNTESLTETCVWYHPLTSPFSLFFTLLFHSFSLSQSLAFNHHFYHSNITHHQSHHRNPI